MSEKMANGPWLRLYTEVLDNPKVQLLSDKFFRWWINLICLAKLGDGLLPTTKEIAWRLRKTEKETNAAIQELVKAGLIDNSDGCMKPHDWNDHQYVSDVSTNRVKRFRETKRNVSRAVSETPNGTHQSRAEQIQSRAEQILPSEESECERGFEAWWKATTELTGNRSQRTLCEQYWVQNFRHFPSVERVVEGTLAYLNSMKPEMRAKLQPSKLLAEDRWRYEPPAQTERDPEEY